MSLLSPLSLIWLLPLAGAIILLYLLKLRRKERMVSSVLLWQDAIADIQANAPFQKLKKNLLLLLQLLALLMLVLAVARPYMRAKGTSENRIAVILDSSASMQSTDVSPSRFEVAKAKALDVVKRMGPGDTMLVIVAGAKTQVVAPFTSDKRSLSAAISKLKPVDTRCNMRQAMVLALSLVATGRDYKSRPNEGPRIVVLSDGLFDPLVDLSPGKARIDFERIGKGCDNVAITGMDSRKTLSGQQQIFVSLRNFATPRNARGNSVSPPYQGGAGGVRRFTLEIYVGDQLFDVREESLAPGETKQEILSNLQNAAGRITAKLDIKDDLEPDNSASVYLAKRRKLSILMVSKGNIFLQNALNLDPRTQLVRTEVTPDLSKTRYDLVIFDRIAPPKSLPHGGYLLIDTAAAQGPADMGPEAQRPAIVDSNQKHTASAYVDFSDVRIASARYLRPKLWATPIIEGEAGPLGAAGSSGGRRFVQLSFSLLESDFPLHVGFPIFVANCLDWLAPAGDAGAGESIRTGQPAYIDVPPSVKQLTLADPTGRTRSVKVTGNPVIIEDTEHAGIYTVKGNGYATEFACNVTSPQESATTPKDAFTVGKSSYASTGQGVRTNREFYGWLIFLALVILTVEWYAYHRRM